MNYPSEQRLAGNSGCLIALLIGIFTVGVVNGGFSLMTGARLNLDEEWSVFLFQALLVAAPFGALATAQEDTSAAWVTAGLLTMIFWGLYVADALVRRGEGGANIGLGLLMLLSPLLITGGAFAAAAIARRRR